MPVGDCGAVFPPAGATVFVDAAFDGGSLDATHFSSLADALAAAPENAVIAVAPGEYSAPLLSSRNVTVRGRCAAQVIIDGAGNDGPSLAFHGAQTSALSGVTVRGGAPSLEVSYGASVTIDAVILEDSRDRALDVYWPKSVALVTHSLVRGTRRVQGDPRAVAVTDHGQATLRDVTLEANVTTGVDARGLSSAATLERVIVRGTYQPDGGAARAAVVASQAGTVVVSQSVLADSDQAGILVDGAETTAKVTDSVLRGSRAVDDSQGYGAYVLSGALTLTDCTITANAGVALVTATPDARLDATRVLVRDTRLDPSGSAAGGLITTGGSFARLTSCAFLGGVALGVRSEGVGSRLELAQSYVAGLEVNSTEDGHGLEVTDGARGDVDGLTVERSGAGGVWVADPGSVLEAKHVLVRDMDRVGVSAREGGMAHLLDSAIIRSRDLAAFVYQASSLSLETTVIRDTRQALGPGGNPGIGAAALLGGALRLSRVAIRDSRAFGVLVDSAPASLEAVVVTGTRAIDDEDVGAAVQLQSDATATLAGLLVSGNDRLGLAVGATSSASLTDSRIEATRAAAERYGHGLDVWDGSRCVVRNSSIGDSTVAGVVVSDSALVLDGADVSRNAVAMHVQGATTLEQRDAVPDSAEPGKVLVSTDTRFRDNGVLQGTGLLPLPASASLGH